MASSLSTPQILAASKSLISSIKSRNAASTFSFSYARNAPPNAIILRSARTLTSAPPPPSSAAMAFPAVAWKNYAGRLPNLQLGRRCEYSSSSGGMIGIATSLTSFACSSAIAGAVTFCQSEDDNNDNNQDQDIISKIKSKLESTSFPTSLPTTLDDDTINSILTTIGAKTQSAINSGIPSNLSYGFLMGYLSGLALKKVGKVASIGLGLSFIALQSLAYAGYIDVHHEKLEKEVYDKLLDRNKDGKVDSEDLKSIVEEVKKVVGYGLLEGEDDQVKAIAGGGGFGLGFLGGLRSG